MAKTIKPTPVKKTGVVKQEKMVTLQVGDRTQQFKSSHAQRILSMDNNGGWHLPEKDGDNIESTD